jgi:flagellar basal-body rod protein FlgB
MASLIGSNTSALLKLALDAAAMRQRTIAHNIANANTPGYQPQRVSFEERFAVERAALADGRKVALSSLSDYRPMLELAEPNALGDRAVSLDAELVALSENTLHHQVLLKVLNRHFSIIGTAVNEGKR